MNRTEVDNFFKCVERVDKAKESLKTMEAINWETDITKIDLSALRNCWVKKDQEYQTIKIEYRPKEVVCGTGSRVLFYDATGDDQVMCNTIELIQSGNINIIPPIYVRNIKFIDGVISETSQEYRADGGHRVSIASCLQSDTIPIILCERITNFQFNRSKWNITHNSEILVFESTIDEKRYEFKILNWSLKLDELGNFIIERS